MKSQLPIKIISFLFILSAFSVISTGCSGSSTPNPSDLVMASMDGMPDEVKSAPVAVQQAYQFAAANPDILKQIPCYCGCGAMGHTSNYSCYVSDVDLQAKVTYDTHALGCSICVDITQDTMRLLKQGMPVLDIRANIDQTYSKYGLSNMP